MKKKRKPMLLKTIFDLGDISQAEANMTLFPSYSTIKNRLSRKVPFEKVESPLSKDEYIAEKSKEDMAYDLFLVMRNRGLFDKAREYEILAQHDAVKDFESIPRDLFMRNELEYYKWRKEH